VSKLAQEQQKHDVIIVGAGMVGLVLAQALADHGLKIALVESNKQQAKWDEQHVGQRVSAITQASQHILEALGAWTTIEKMRISPFRDMHVWDATGDGVIHFDSAEIGKSYLGHIVENSAIQTALYNTCKNHDNISWHQPAKPEKITADKRQISLHLVGGSILDAKLIVGADGGNSWVRKSANIEVKSTDYKQTAVVATVKTQQHHKETAWQRFLPTGPLAFLPLNDGYSSIVWSTSPDNADELISMNDNIFCEELAKSFGHQLGNITETSTRAKFPLRSQHALQYTKDRLVLVGDAAHTIHPLAGQGVNLGFADAASLAEIIIDATLAKKDCGRLETLRRYERWRKGENLAMLTAMTGFKTLFSNENSFLTAIRNMGLNMTNSVAPVKNTIIRHAMGLSGDLPKLARNSSL
jgi:2-octaprenylphenol hydroxylase